MGLNESVKVEMNKSGHFGHLNGQNWAEVIPHISPICRFYSTRSGYGNTVSSRIYADRKCIVT